MEYRNLGKSGLKISALSYGSYVTFGGQVDLAAAVQLLRTAYEHGVNYFDNAEVYADGESERIMGRAIAELGWQRDTYLVSSKVFFGATPDCKPTQRGLSRKHVIEACDQALERLRVDYLDLYFCHRPDPETPIEETVRAMHDLIRQGKVLYWGTSEWSARQIKQAFRIADQRHLTPPTMEQPQYNLLHRNRLELEYGHLCERYGLGTTTWGPLRSGLLSGKYNDGFPEHARLDPASRELATQRGQRMLGVARGLTQIAESIQTTPARLAIAWCLRNPHVSSVILGASSVEQLEDNLGALQVCERLGPEVMQRIDHCVAQVPERRLFRIPGGRKLAASAYALGLR